MKDADSKSAIGFFIGVVFVSKFSFQILYGWGWG